MDSWEVTLNFGDKIPGKELLILLEKIDGTGSLNRAVDEAGMSYRYGWGLLNRAEKTLGQTLVARQTGGTAGGGTTLTTEGKKLLGHMQSLQREVQGQLSSLLGEREPEEANHLMLASTTEPVVTGLLDVLEQAFLNETGITVRHLSTGSGQALGMARAGRVDVVLTHAPVLEEEFMRDGWGVFQLFVMSNDFIVVGPHRDPAGVATATSAIEAFRNIAKDEAVFVSRGDRSGTHLHEMMLWEKAGIKPEGLLGYQKAHNMLGNYGVLRKAAEVGGYALVDRASYVTGYAGEELKVLHSGGNLLINRFNVTPVSRKKAAVNQNGAETFSRWLVSASAKKIITEFGQHQFGFPLFTPSK
jgi:tungstate transport system substrate-binding protein